LRVLYPVGPIDSQQRGRTFDTLLQEPFANYSQHYVAQQRDAFLQGVPPPDFPGGAGESEFSDKATTKDILSNSGKRAMGLSPFSTSETTKEKESLVSEVNKILGY
jgi:hypothetical protein